MKISPFWKHLKRIFYSRIIYPDKVVKLFSDIQYTAENQPGQRNDLQSLLVYRQGR